MLQNLVSLFNLRLFGQYLLVSLVFTVIMVKLYLASLKRIEDNTSFKPLVAVAIIMYALLIGFMIYTIVVYGFLSVTVTSAVMYAIMFYPMKKLTGWLEQKGISIIGVK